MGGPIRTERGLNKNWGLGRISQPAGRTGRSTRRHHWTVDPILTCEGPGAIWMEEAWASRRKGQQSMCLCTISTAGIDRDYFGSGRICSAVVSAGSLGGKRRLAVSRFIVQRMSSALQGGRGRRVISEQPSTAGWGGQFFPLACRSIFSVGDSGTGRIRSWKGGGVEGCRGECGRALGRRVAIGVVDV